MEDGIIERKNVKGLTRNYDLVYITPKKAHRMLFQPRLINLYVESDKLDVSQEQVMKVYVKTKTILLGKQDYPSPYLKSTRVVSWDDVRIYYEQY